MSLTGSKVFKRIRNASKYIIAGYLFFFLIALAGITLEDFRHGINIFISLSVVHHYVTPFIIGILGAGSGMFIHFLLEEQEKSRERLQKSERKLRTFLDQAGDAIYLHDYSGKVLDANRVALRDLGYSFEEMLKLNVNQFDYRYSDLMEYRGKVVNLGENQEITIESEYIRKDGSVYPVEIKVCRISPGYESLFLSIARDITERKLIEEELIRSKDRFKTLFQNAPLSYQSLDSDGYLIDLNPAWEKTFGYTRDEALGRHFSEFMTDESARKQRKLFPKFLKQGEVSNAEFDMVRKNGERFNSSLYGKVSYNLQGEVKSTHCIIADITDQKRAERKLIQYQYYLEKAQEIGKIGSWKYNIAENRLSWTRETYNILGIPENHPLNIESLLEKVHPDDHEYVKAKWESAMKGEAYELENRILVNGKEKWIRQKANMSFNSENECIRAIGFIQDITADKKMQDALTYVSQLGWKERGKEFYHSMVLFLVQKLETDYAFISELEPGGKVVHTLGLCRGKKILEPIVYSLKDTPCDNVVDKKMSIYPSAIQEQFPKDLILKDMKAESYAGSPLWDSKGNPIGVIGIIGRNEIVDPELVRSVLSIVAQRVAHEIEQNRDERILKESEERFRKLSQLSFEGIFIHENGIIREVNRSFEKITGYNYNELFEKNIVDFLVPDDYKPIILKYLGWENAPPFEIQLRRKNGSQLPVELESKELSFNKEVFNVTAVRDISRRKIVEDSMNRYLTAVEQSANLIIITGTDGKIQYVNDRFCSTTGYTREEVLGKNPRVLKSGKHEKDFYQQLWKTIVEGGVWNGILCNKKKNGELYWESAIITPVLNDLGRIVNYIAIKEDITEKRLANQKLFNAVIEAEERERKRFAEDLHDELGPFLSGIKLYINELGFSDLNPEKRNSLINSLKEFINEAVEKTRTISNKLMPSSLFEYGLVAATESFCQKINQTGQVEIDFSSDLNDEIRDKTLEVIVYRISIELINNTLKHANAEKITIRMNGNRDSLDFTYTDDGLGFDLEEMLKTGDGLGLKNITNRIKSIGGNYSFKRLTKGGIEFKFTIKSNQQ